MLVQSRMMTMFLLHYGDDWYGLREIGLRIILQAGLIEYMCMRKGLKSLRSCTSAI